MNWETYALQVIYARTCTCTVGLQCLVFFSKQTLKLHMNLTAVFRFVTAVRTVGHAVTVARLGDTHAKDALELVLSACAVLLVIVRCRCVTDRQVQKY